jgi:hypothetical protein
VIRAAAVHLECSDGHSCKERRVRGTRQAAAIVLGAVVAACNGAEPPAPCTQPSSLTIGAGLTPTIDWSPPCLVYRLEIQDSTNTVVWQIQTTGGDRLTSHITYGVVPEGATQVVAPVPLESGKFYAAGLFTFTGSAPPNDAALLSAKGFRPKRRLFPHRPHADPCTPSSTWR